MTSNKIFQNRIAPTLQCWSCHWFKGVFTKSYKCSKYTDRGLWFIHSRQQNCLTWVNLGITPFHSMGDGHSTIGHFQGCGWLLLARTFESISLGCWGVKTSNHRLCLELLLCRSSGSFIVWTMLKAISALAADLSISRFLSQYQQHLRCE